MPSGFLALLKNLLESPIICVFDISDGKSPISRAWEYPNKWLFSGEGFIKVHYLLSIYLKSLSKVDDETQQHRPEQGIPAIAKNKYFFAKTPINRGV